MLGRFLDDLEQCAETRRRDHVRLVDDEDAVPALRGRVESSVTQFASVVDPAMAGRVEFDDVNRAAAVGCQGHARVARAPHGVGVGPSAQFNDRARIRADDVLPQPRGPENR